MLLAKPSGSCYNCISCIYIQHIWHCFRVFANAIITASFCIGSIIGPQTFRAEDAPRYIPAKLALLATQSAAIMVAITARLYYGWQNSRKEKLASTQQTIKDIEWLNCECQTSSLQHEIDMIVWQLPTKKIIHSGINIRFGAGTQLIVISFISH
jgi:hypothetical protein